MVTGWIEKSIGELFSISGGRSASRADLSDRGIFYLHYGDIHASTKTYVDTDDDSANIPRLDVPLNKVSTKSLLQDGDVVFVDASEDDIGASKHIVIKNTAGVPFISGLHTIVAKPLTEEIDKTFRQYCFQTAAVQCQFKYYAVGTKVIGINKATIKRIFIYYPESIPEQRAIAAVLSDVDGYIAALERLIAKKRNIKKGAMQELLTGKRRLPGFDGEWVETTLGMIGVFSKGRGISKADARSGQIPCIRYGEIYTMHNNFIKAFYSHISQTIAISSRKLKKEDLVFAGSGETKEEIGKCVAFLCDCEAYAGGDIIVLSPLNGFDSLFLGYYLNSKKIIEQKASRGQGDAIVHIHISSLSEIELYIPPTIAEQSAIAAVLSEMDAEIDALTAKLNKARDIKQGMMQELLTGRIRLVLKETDAVSEVETA